MQPTFRTITFNNLPRTKRKVVGIEKVTQLIVMPFLSRVRNHSWSLHTTFPKPRNANFTREFSIFRVGLSAKLRLADASVSVRLRQFSSRELYGRTQDTVHSCVCIPLAYPSVAIILHTTFFQKRKKLKIVYTL